MHFQAMGSTCKALNSTRQAPCIHLVHPPTSAVDGGAPAAAADAAAAAAGAPAEAPVQAAVEPVVVPGDDLGVVEQVAFEPGYHVSGSRVETRCFQSMGQLAPPHLDELPVDVQQHVALAAVNPGV
jgi:hypothetical protein